MHKLIQNLAEQAFEGNDHIPDIKIPKEFIEKFAHLMVHEFVTQCNKEWYALNNQSKDGLDSRAISMRQGQKIGILKIQSRIKQHFGTKE